MDRKTNYSDERMGEMDKQEDRWVDRWVNRERGSIDEPKGAS